MWEVGGYTNNKHVTGKVWTFLTYLFYAFLLQIWSMRLDYSNISMCGREVTTRLKRVVRTTLTLAIKFYLWWKVLNNYSFCWMHYQHIKIMQSMINDPEQKSKGKLHFTMCSINKTFARSICPAGRARSEQHVQLMTSVLCILCLVYIRQISIWLMVLCFWYGKWKCSL